MGVRHMVMLSLKDGATDEQKKAAVDALLGLDGIVPGMRSYSAGLDLGINGTHGLGIVADFDDTESFHAYIAHERHKSVAAEYLVPIMDGSTRVEYALEP